MQVINMEKSYTIEFKEKEIEAIKLCLGLLQIRDKDLKHTITSTYDNHIIGSPTRVVAAKLLDELNQNIHAVKN